MQAPVIFALVTALTPSFLWAQSSCHDLFQSSVEGSVTATPAVDIPALQALELVAFPIKDLTMAEVKDFSSDKGSLQVLLKGPFRQSADGLKDYVISLIYNLTETSTTVFQNLKYFVPPSSVLTHAKRGDWGAKRNIMSLLRGLEPLIAAAVGKDKVDLLALNTWFELYGVTNLKDLMVRIEESRQKMRQDKGSYKDYQSPERVEMLAVAHEVNRQIFQVVNSSHGIAVSGRLHHFAETVRSLIDKLHLSSERRAHYEELLKEFEGSNWVSSLTGKYRQMFHDTGTINFFIHAYLEKFPYLSPKDIQSRFTNTWFLGAVRNTEIFDKVYETNEARLSENLTQAMSINEQVDRLLNDADVILNASKREGAEAAEQVAEIYVIKAEAEVLRVIDLTTENLDSRIDSLQSLQFRLHHPTEKILNAIGPQAIETFAELNFNWSRVVEGKSYAIEGRDYQAVVFEKNVMQFLKREPIVGDRALVALEKGYVGTHGQTGVRMVTTLHKDLRYIKVMVGRKVRIVGKLVNGTIHFFSVWDKDENWDVSWMYNHIEKYTPR